MQIEQIYRRLTDVFRSVFDDDNIVVIPELSAKDVEGWDSLNHLRLIITVQKEFNVKFSAAEVNRLDNVADMVSLIGSKL
jgi:acyl carrier protein